MVSWLRDILEGRARQAPPHRTPGFEPKEVPEPALAEPPSPPAPVEAIESPLKGQGFVIIYGDHDGFESERRIRLTTVFQSGPHAYISAYCYEAMAPRTFRVDRIKAAFCAVHGDELATPLDLFIPVETRAPMGAHLAKHRQPLSHKPIRATLRALMAVARCDGEIHPAELEVIRGYLAEVLPQGSTVTEIEDLVQYADRLVADYDQVIKGLDVATEDPALTMPFLLAAAAVAGADGRLANEERALLEDVRWIARGRGIELG